MLKVVYFLSGSPVSASTISMPIFDITATEDKTNISTPILSESGKNSLSFGSLAARANPKISVGGFGTYSSTIKAGGFKFGSSKRGSEFDTLPKIKTEYVSGKLLVILPTRLRAR